MSSAPPSTPLDGTFDDDRGPAVRTFVIVMMVIATAAVILRFWSRTMSSHNDRRMPMFWWDDWVALAALPFLLATGALVLDIIGLGLGRHIWAVPSQNVVPTLLRLFIIYLLYDTTLVLTKASCMLFYERIFGKPYLSKWFTWALQITQGMNIAWYIGLIFGTVFMCNPVAKNWNPELPGHCDPTSGLWLGSAIPSVIIDFILLVLPMPLLWKLKIKPARKLGIFIIFFLGYCVIVVSLGRLITIIRAEDGINQDFTYASIPALYWQVAEAPITMLCVCLPAMVNLGRQVSTGIITPLFNTISSSLSLVKISVSKSAGSSSLMKSSERYNDLDSHVLVTKNSNDSTGLKLQPIPAPNSYVADISAHEGLNRAVDVSDSNIHLQRSVDISRNC